MAGAPPVVAALSLAVGVASTVVCAVPPGATPGGPPEPRPPDVAAPTGLPAGVLDYEIVATYPHDAAAFTQGLAFADGWLWEGTGRRGASSVRKVELETGRVVERVDLAGNLFGEGIAVLGDRLFQLTWLAGSGRVYRRADLAAVEEFHYEGEGWGLAAFQDHLVMSDGSASLSFRDPAGFRELRRVVVRDTDGPVEQLNELEWIDDEIWANVWHRDSIVRIDPTDGRVVGRLDLSALVAGVTVADPEGVLNGIAHDRETGRIFVTGKLWPRLFEIRPTGPEAASGTGTRGAEPNRASADGTIDEGEG